MPITINNPNIFFSEGTTQIFVFKFKTKLYDQPTIQTVKMEITKFLYSYNLFVQENTYMTK